MPITKKKILVVEDEPAIARGLKDILQLENYAVVSCADGKSALTKAVSSAPDLVILDIGLPILNGVEVCRELRAKGYTVPILMLSSRSEEIDIVLALESGANDYVIKPFKARELLARVRAHLRPPPQPSVPSKLPPNSDKPVRRLLAVMFTDMKDYSKKMNENENLA